MNRGRYAAVIALTALFGGVLLIEFFARVVLGLGDPPLSTPHPSIEYLLRPSQDVVRFGNRIVVNEYAMRSESFPKAKAPSELRILIFGDSVINGGNLTDHEDLATTLLARRLEQESGRTVRVGNVSAGSWGPGNWLAYILEFGFFDADVVVVVASSHDATDNPTFAPLDPGTHPQKKPPLALIEGAVRYVPRYLTWSNSSRPRPTAEPQEHALAMQQGLADLRAFLLLARENASRVFLLQHPELKELEAGRYRPGGDAIAQVAAECEVPIVSLAPAYSAALERGEQPYRDNIHINEVGQSILATTLLRELAWQ